MPASVVEHYAYLPRITERATSLTCANIYCFLFASAVREARFRWGELYSDGI